MPAERLTTEIGQTEWKYRWLSEYIDRRRTEKQTYRPADKSNQKSSFTFESTMNPGLQTVKEGGIFGGFINIIIICSV